MDSQSQRSLSPSHQEDKIDVDMSLTGESHHDPDDARESSLPKVETHDEPTLLDQERERTLTIDEAFALDAQLRYGVQRKTAHGNNAGSGSIAVKIVTRVAQDGTQPPTKELLAWLNMSRRDLAEGMDSALAEMCRLHCYALWNPAEPRKTEILAIFKKWGPFSPNTMTDSSELIEVDCEKFLNMLRDVSLLWQWRHPNPEDKDKSLDFSSVSPYIYGCESGELSGFTSDPEDGPDPVLFK